jgi:hypothetical protein
MHDAPNEKADLVNEALTGYKQLQNSLLYVFLHVLDLVENELVLFGGLICAQPQIFVGKQRHSPRPQHLAEDLMPRNHMLVMHSELSLNENYQSVHLSHFVPERVCD